MVASLWIGMPLPLTVNWILVALPSGLVLSTVPMSIPAIRTGESLRTLTLLLTTA